MLSCCVVAVFPFQCRYLVPTWYQVCFLGLASLRSCVRSVLKALLTIWASPPLGYPYTGCNTLLLLLILSIDNTPWDKFQPRFSPKPGGCDSAHNEHGRFGEISSRYFRRCVAWLGVCTHSPCRRDKFVWKLSWVLPYAVRTCWLGSARARSSPIPWDETTALMPYRAIILLI